MKPGRELNDLVAEKVMEWNDVWQPFQPSTEISDAWLVADKLKIAIIPQSESAPEQYKYLAEYSSYRPWEEDKKIEVFAETAPLAICLAALKAVGVEQ